MSELKPNVKQMLFNGLEQGQYSVSEALAVYLNDSDKYFNVSKFAHQMTEFMLELRAFGLTDGDKPPFKASDIKIEDALTLVEKFDENP